MAAAQFFLLVVNECGRRNECREVGKPRDVGVSVSSASADDEFTHEELDRRRELASRAAEADRRR